MRHTFLHPIPVEDSSKDSDLSVRIFASYQQRTVVSELPHITEGKTLIFASGQNIGFDLIREVDHIVDDVLRNGLVEVERHEFAISIFRDLDPIIDL